MTAERFAAAAKIILDEDRRADRERIAELERDLGFFQESRSVLVGDIENRDATIVHLNKQLDELNEKCAALILERDEIARDHRHMREQMSTQLAAIERDTTKAANAVVYANIDTDMSDPQPGKLLVVRLDADDVGRAWVPLGEMSDRGRETQNFWPEQRVGFLVETPEVKRTPKVGDRVRIIDGANAGEAAAVRAIDSIDPDCFCLMLADGERWFAHVDNLEVIE